MWQETKINNIKHLIMTKINNKTIGEALYDAPSISVLDVQSEGLLCASPNFTINDWETDNEDLDF